ncbi:MAG: replication-associated recombination protein A [Candidatus Muiribacteriota bacterium]
MKNTLADFIRPETISDFVGQEHLFQEKKPLNLIFQSQKPVSMIMWGPPGCGKTTLAALLKNHFSLPFEKISAVMTGIPEARKIIEKARIRFEKDNISTILFIDEIHRFNKAQQDAFLFHVEKGTIILIGATTENPSFSVNNALLSRVRVFKFEPLSEENMKKILNRVCLKIGFQLDKEAEKIVINYSGGDARKLLNSLETFQNRGIYEIKENDIAEILKMEINTSYDKTGDYHYDLISAFHKSLRGSNPDAAVYWMFRMLEGGEEPLYIVRRMIRFASEDIGLADPHALTLAVSTLETVKFLGMPEGDNAMTELAVYLAVAPKSNSVYKMTNKAKEVARQYNKCKVPLHLRNAPTKLMKEMGYAKAYKYPHDYKEGLVRQEYMPDELRKKSWYSPTENGKEKRIKERYLKIKDFLSEKLGADRSG